MSHSYSVFKPAWWVPGCHAQTLWGKFFRRTEQIDRQSERWDTPDGDFVDLYRVGPIDYEKTDSETPRVVILHGLEGSIRSHYVNGLFREIRKQNWYADLLLFRSCGDEMNRGERFYHSGETSDLGFVIDRLVKENPNQPIFLVGISLGGNVVLKYLGEKERGVSANVLGAAAVSVPFDLNRGSRFISRGFSRVYECHFLQSLKIKVQKKLIQYPRLNLAKSWDEATTLFDFDDRVTAPVHGFADAVDYYSRSSSINFLNDIAIRTLLLSSRDDPFLPVEVLEEVEMVVSERENLIAEFTDKGGHVGFVGGLNPLYPDYYMERRVVEHFLTCLG